jgi:acetyl esterase/lipase
VVKSRSVTVMKMAYGDDPDQWAELERPPGDCVGVAVVIHGGFWRAAYDASLGRALASDLVARGWTAYNIEYRRVGRGGGWPTTLQDVSDAIDHLAEQDLDLSRVVAIGHSAGGHLATWAAGRSQLPAQAPGAAPRVHLTGVVSQAGVVDLTTGVNDGVGGTAIADLLGGYPDDVPDRYDWADPLSRVPLPVPVVCVHGRHDDAVPIAQSEAYVAAATRVGAHAELVAFDGDHMMHVDPTSHAWTLTLDALARIAT